MSNAVSETKPDNTELNNTEEENNPESIIEETDNNSRSVKESKEEVIIPEIVKDEPTETTLVSISDKNVSDIAQNTTTKKKSTLSKVGKSLATIIASI